MSLVLDGVRTEVAFPDAVLDPETEGVPDTIDDTTANDGDVRSVGDIAEARMHTAGYNAGGSRAEVAGNVDVGSESTCATLYIRSRHHNVFKSSTHRGWQRRR